MTIEDLRKEFPILCRKIHGNDLIYFDNAATAQKPKSVIDKWVQMACGSNANIHRAVHCLSVESTEEYENTRKYVKDFINAGSAAEIVFTSGATAAINLVAFCFGESFINPGDEIILTEAEHHSNMVPWKLMAERKGASILVWKTDENGDLNLDDLRSLITSKTKILAMTHVSNVLGLVYPIEEACRICHSHGVKILVDGSQGIVHQDVDVSKGDFDFYVFSGHKIYAATGTGVLYGKKEILDAFCPYMGGGEMIESVSFEKVTYSAAPMKFEAGTQNILSVPTLIPAIEMAKAMKDKNLLSETEEIKKAFLQRIAQDERITLYGNTPDMERKISLFSFSVKNCHHEDLSHILDKMGVAVRSGKMCCEPLMNKFGVSGLLRVSLAPYNNMNEVERFFNAMEKAIKMLV